MPVLKNDELNIALEINLVRNKNIDIKTDRENFMNWIPFELTLLVQDEIINYNSEVITTLCIEELNYFISNLKSIIEVKTNKQFLKSCFKFISREYLFELIINETKEDGLLELTIWFNVGSLTNGCIYGFSKGFRFIVMLNDLKKFTLQFEEQFRDFL